MEAAAIILAAGAGIRMKSKRPKVVHEILGKPLVRWVVDAVRDAGITRVVTVVGHGSEQVEPFVKDTQVVLQPKRLGTANAIEVCRETLEGFRGSLVVLYGDTPLISAATIGALADLRAKENAAAVVLTMEPDDPYGYGRVIRNDEGDVIAIVEQKDATPEQAMVRECNSGMYCFDAAALFGMLPQVKNNNAKGEFYITDVIGLLHNAGRRVVAMKSVDPAECLGVNSRIQLAEAGKVLQRRVNRHHMKNGVTMLDPELVWISPEVRLAQDVTLLPGVMLMGATSIDEGSLIGPNTRLTDTVVGKDCVVDETVAIECLIDDRVKCGPRAYLRPGTHMCDDSKAGTHVEIKKSTIGKGSKVPHLSYIGDTTMGAGVNIGAGSITCNYDGFHKHQTHIGDDVFVGSDTMMVAPVEIGEGAIIGAGSVITNNVTAGALGLGRARQKELKGWAHSFREKKNQ